MEINHLYIFDLLGYFLLLIMLVIIIIVLEDEGLYSLVYYR